MISVCPFSGVYALNSILTGVNYTKPKNMKGFGNLYAPDEADITVSATFEFPNQSTATMLLTAQASPEYVKQLNHVCYIGTKGYIKINDFINNPKAIEVNGQIINTDSSDGQENKYNWGNIQIYYL